MLSLVVLLWCGAWVYGRDSGRGGGSGVVHEVW